MTRSHEADVVIVGAGSDRQSTRGYYTATYWSAYMEGAVDAGERAAHEVIDELTT